MFLTSSKSSDINNRIKKYSWFHKKEGEKKISLNYPPTVVHSFLFPPHGLPLFLAEHMIFVVADIFL
jgi:hypothetical protein